MAIGVNPKAQVNLYQGNPIKQKKETSRSPFFSDSVNIKIKHEPEVLFLPGCKPDSPGCFYRLKMKGQPEKGRWQLWQVFSCVF